MADGDWVIGGLIGLAGVILVGMLGVIVVAVPATAQISRECLQRGYPGSRMDWTLQGYCVKRVDQTDVVLMLPAGS